MLASVFCALALPADTRAQLMPGGKGVDVDAQQAQFNGVMVKVVRSALQTWQEAWSKVADASAVTDRYHSEATIVQAGGPLIAGHVAVRAFTDSLRKLIRDGSLGFSDFEASEGIAYIYGPFSLEPRDGTSPTINGQHLTVLRRDNKGFLIRSQMFVPQSGAARISFLPAQHPGGPLTVQSMANAATVARYKSANELLTQLHRSWSDNDSTGVFALFNGNATVQLPGQSSGMTGARARAALNELLERSGDLHFVALDYDASGRLGVVMGQYYIEIPGADALNGYFGMVLDWRENKWMVRALVFA
jgi:ketosteroid isomerase-like protein